MTTIKATFNEDLNIVTLFIQGQKEGKKNTRSVIIKPSKKQLMDILSTRQEVEKLSNQ
jgi:hypothetical protein